MANTMPEHPLYKRLPVIPGDHAYNIAVAAVGLVVDGSPDRLKALREHTLTGGHTSVPTEALVELFDVISDELDVDVLGWLIQSNGGQAPTTPLHKPQGLRFPSPGEEPPATEPDPVPSPYSGWM